MTLTTSGDSTSSSRIANSSPPRRPPCHRAGRRLDPVGERLQGLVALAVAERSLTFLKLSRSMKSRAALVRAAAAQSLEGVVDPVLESRTVRQAGQRLAVREQPQLLVQAGVVERDGGFAREHLGKLDLATGERVRARRESSTTPIASPRTMSGSMSRVLYPISRRFSTSIVSASGLSRSTMYG